MVLDNGEKEANLKLSGRLEGILDRNPDPFNRAETRYQFEIYERKIAELEELAGIDHLTGLSNRKGFENLLKNKISGKEEDNEDRRESCNYIAIVSYDVDYFKSDINDIYGHPTGDEVLKRISESTRSFFRRQDRDIVARFGGDEFVVAFDTESEENALQRVYNLLCRIREIEILDIDRMITITAGVALYEKGSQIEIEKVLKDADRNLYAGKNLGKNCVVGSQGQILS